MRRFLQRRQKAATSDQDDTPPRLIATSSAARKTVPCGIKPLFSPENAVIEYACPSFDEQTANTFSPSIVFVHGLTGDRDKTWTAQDASEPWPKTLLPSKLPTARILSFGYDAYVANWRGVVSQNRIESHAWNLLTSLASYREDDNTVGTVDTDEAAALIGPE